MVPSPGGQEAWTRRLQGSRLVSEGFPDSRLKFQRRERRRRQRASRHPNLSQPTSPRSPLPRRTSSEVTVPGARGAPRTELHRWPLGPSAKIRAASGAGSQRPEPRSLSLPCPGLARGAAKSFPGKVRGGRSRSQPPATTASPRFAWPPGRAARARPPRRVSLCPAPTRFTYHRAGRRAAGG